MKILIVDDSAVMRKIVTRTLRQAGFGGHDLDEAADGAEALVKIEAETPDLVLSDWNMPNMKGIELLQILREKEVDVPFAFITSECTDEMKLQADESGAVAFLTKPFTADTLRDTFEKILD